MRISGSVCASLFILIAATSSLVRADCAEGDRIDRVAIRDLGYSGSGSKKRFCLTNGYEGFSSGVCFRECVDLCMKKSIRDLGYVGGKKNKFCREKGFEGAQGTGKLQGYCWQPVNGGTQDDCTL